MKGSEIFFLWKNKNFLKMENKKNEDKVTG